LQPVEKVAKVMERPFYMNPKKAVDFGVADKVCFLFYIIIVSVIISGDISETSSSVFCKVVGCFILSVLW